MLHIMESYSAIGQNYLYSFIMYFSQSQNVRKTSQSERTDKPTRTEK